MALLNMPVADADEPRPSFFTVGIPKLIFMATATFGLYEVYWLYEQWSAIQFRDQTRRDLTGSYRDIRPFWRAVFAPFFVYPLFGEIGDTARRFGARAPFPAGPAAVAFILLLLSGRVPGPWGLATFFSVVPIAMAQRVANEAMATSGAPAEPNTALRGWNWAAVALGAPLFLLALLGAFLSE